MASPVVRLKTHAKINLFLRVRGGRPDGYHNIDTIFHTIDLSDAMELRRATNDEIDVRMHQPRGVRADIPSGEGNLVVRAAKALARRTDKASGARIDVAKRIPVGAGLAGGSANAAGTLVGLNDLWGAALDAREIHDVGLEVGSDVPFCLTGGCARGTGRGDVLSPIEVPNPIWFVVAVTGIPLATGDVYAAWDGVGPGYEPDGGAAAAALRAGDVRRVAALLHNDLEAAALRLRPELADKKEVLVAAGALGACMSGSGPALFAVAAGAGHAREVAVRVRSDFDFVTVASSRPVGVQRLD
jgi:4-diphosphocytidyl-2-C-methyl-D-erythritol kinase